MVAILLGMIFICVVIFSIAGLTELALDSTNTTKPIEKPFIVGTSNTSSNNTKVKVIHDKDIDTNKPYKTICIEGYTFIQIDKDIEQLFIIKKGTGTVIIPKVCK